MKILRWCGKHKIWTFWIVAIVGLIIYNCLGEGTILTGGSIATGDNSYEQGAFLARAFGVYLIAIWSYAGIKKFLRAINSK